MPRIPADNNPDTSASCLPFFRCSALSLFLFLTNKITIPVQVISLHLLALFFRLEKADSQHPTSLDASLFYIGGYSEKGKKGTTASFISYVASSDMADGPRRLRIVPTIGDRWRHETVQGHIPAPVTARRTRRREPSSSDRTLGGPTTRRKRHRELSPLDRTLDGLITAPVTTPSDLSMQRKRLKAQIESPGKPPLQIPPDYDMHFANLYYMQTLRLTPPALW